MKILIVSYFYPPLNRMGSSRIWGWANNFSETGHDVTLVTLEKTVCDGPLNYVRDSKAKVIAVKGLGWKYLNDVSAENVSKIHKFVNRVRRLLWVFYVVTSLIKKRAKYDLVISTYSPYETHLIGCALKKLKVADSWLADYRDLWIGNPYYCKDSRFSKFIEKIVVGKADVLTAVSEPMKEVLSERFPEKQSLVVYNGYDDSFTCNEEIHELSPGRKVIRFLHAGTIYPGQRDPGLLFKAIAEKSSNFSSYGYDIELLFLGDRIGNIRDLAKEYGLEGKVKVLGQLSRDESINYQKQSDYLLLLSSKGTGHEGIIPAKVFEYISSGVPIIAIGINSDSEVYRIVKGTGCGTLLTEKNYAEVLDGIIAGRSNEWFRPNKSEIRKFSRKEQSYKLEKLIKPLLKG